MQILQPSMRAYLMFQLFLANTNFGPSSGFTKSVAHALTDFYIQEKVCETQAQVRGRDEDE
jgi:hypothetical protein